MLQHLKDHASELTCFQIVLVYYSFLLIFIWFGFVFLFLVLFCHCFVFAFCFVHLDSWFLFLLLFCIRMQKIKVNACSCFRWFSLLAVCFPSTLLRSESPTVPYSCTLVLPCNRLCLCGCNTLRSFFRNTIVLDVVWQSSLVKSLRNSHMYENNLSGPVRETFRPQLASLCPFWPWLGSLCQCHLLCNSVHGFWTEADSDMD